MWALLMRLSTHPLPLSLSQGSQALPLACIRLMNTTINKFKRKFAATVPAEAVTSNGNLLQCQPVSTKPKVIIITGPTAVGKTKLALELAQEIGGEIISADSVQVYRGLDVGSDKLPLEERGGICHHLIDILDPQQEFSAGDFYKLGRQAAEDVLARGKVPVVAGGTGFYLRWFIHGRPSTPASSPEAAAQALQLIGRAWVEAAAQVTAAQQDMQHQQDAPQQPLAAANQQDTEHEQQAQSTQCTRAQQQPAKQRQEDQAMGGLAPCLDSRSVDQQVCPDTLDSSGAPAGGQQTSSESSNHSNTQPAVEDILEKLPTVTQEAALAAQQLSEDQRWNVAVDVVQQLGDSQTADRIREERNNWYRLQRVLQILIQNGGKPLSEIDIDTTRELDYDFRCFFLHRPRLELFGRIVYRVEEMVDGGLLQEALMLLDQGLQPDSAIATRAIGYRQALKFMMASLLKGSATEQELQQLIFDIATASRNLVKNQTTWFRDDDMFRWIEVGGRSTDDVLHEVLKEVAKPRHEGGCGGSGRFDKATLAALKRYVPKLKLYSDPSRVQKTLDWIAAVAEEHKQKQKEGYPCSVHQAAVVDGEEQSNG